jgi:cytidyltransferase-like protein
MVQLKACRYVDQVIIYKTEKDLIDLLKKLKPDVRFLGADWKDKDFTGKELPIKVIFNKRDHNFSTSNLREKIINNGHVKRIEKKVFVSGCYDILHGGHIEFFNQAKTLGDYLIVSFASDMTLEKYKNKKSSIPEAHKRKILESLRMVDEVVMGDNLDEVGLDFKNHFLKIKPDILAVTEDDHFSEQKIALCKEIGAQYIVLPKNLAFKKTSTTEIIKKIKNGK